MYEQNTKITMTVKDLVCLTHRFDQDEHKLSFGSCLYILYNTAAYAVYTGILY